MGSEMCIRDRYNSLPLVGGAALWKSGLFPFFVDARRVNCDTGKGGSVLAWHGVGKIAHQWMATMMAGYDVRRKEHNWENAPQRISPSMSWTLHFHFLPSSPSHNFTLRTLLAMDWASLAVSSLPMAAKIRRPLPIVEISWPSTVTDADFTLWITAKRC